MAFYCLKDENQRFKKFKKKIIKYLRLNERIFARKITIRNKF